MAHKVLRGGTAYAISGGQTLVGGTGYGISGGKTLVGGTAYDISFVPTLGSLDVGTVLTLNSVDYIIVHQGLPSSMYDSSCDGTWLLRKDVWSLSISRWGYTYNNYANSQAHKYAESASNSYYVGQLSSASFKGYIKQVKIPYVYGNGDDNVVYSGSNGLSTHVFNLSGYELGFTTSVSSYLPADGACLSYFSGSGNTDANRKSGYGGYDTTYFTRSPSTANATTVYHVSDTGGLVLYTAGLSGYIRPAFILPSDLPLPEIGL